MLQYLHFADELKTGEKCILTGVIMTFLFGGFGDLTPLLGLFLMLIGLIILVRKIGLKKSLATPLTRPVLLFILVAILSLIKITGPLSAASMMGTLLEFSISFFAAYYLFRNKTDEFYKNMFKILLIGGALSALTGVYEKFFLNSRRLRLVLNPNILGIYMMFLFFLALSVIFRKNVKYKIGGIFLVFLFGFNLIYSLSRSAFLGAITGLFFFFSFKSKKLLIIFLIIILILPLILPVSLTSRFFKTYQDFVTGDYEQRIYIWESAYEIFKRNPIFGIGIGQFRENYKTYLSPEAPIQNRIFSHTHNIFIQIITELGIVGFLIFIYLLILLIKIIYNSLPFPDTCKGDFLLGFSAALIGFFVQEMFEFSLSSSAFTVLFGILLPWYLVLINETLFDQSAG